MAGEVVEKLEISFYFNVDEEGNITDSAAILGNYTEGGNVGNDKYRHEVVLDSWEIPIHVDIIQWKYGTFIYKENPDGREFTEAVPPPLNSFYRPEDVKDNTIPSPDEKTV